jgi:hypothetical protein
MRRKSEFGPNQERVDDLLERLETVDQGQALFLASLAGDDSSRRAARSAVLAAARASGRQKELDAAQREVTRWVNTWFSGGFQLSGYGRDVTPGEAAVGAAPVILDAVGALVMADRISPEDFETLIGPWRELDTTADPAGADFERLVSLMRELTAMLEQQGERRWAEWVRRDLAQVVDHDAHTSSPRHSGGSTSGAERPAYPPPTVTQPPRFALSTTASTSSTARTPSANVGYAWAAAGLAPSTIAP